MNVSERSLHKDRAFTLTDLLVLLATVVLLLVVVFPVFAGVQNKGGRLQCADNLRQIGMGSMIFAGDNNGWLPPCSFSAGSTNQLNGVFYTYYVFYGAGANTQIPTNAPAQGNYENEGYLYHAGLAGNGSIFYCPGQWANGGFGADSFSPLVTANSTGNVYSSYFYNPRMLKASSGSTLRRYQTTSQLEPHRLFALDELAPLQWELRELKFPRSPTCVSEVGTCFLPTAALSLLALPRVALYLTRLQQSSR